MRSRLEARFAAILDADGFKWTYEPRAFADESGQYLPDFEVWMYGLTVPTYIEVKPTFHLALKATARMEIIWSSEPEAILAVWLPDGDVLIAGGLIREWDLARWDSAA
jgi:hypothetical protein